MTPQPKSTYQIACETECRWCGMGLSVCRDRKKLPTYENPNVVNGPHHHPRNNGDQPIPCTAPTPEQFMERQANQLRECEQQIEFDRSEVAKVVTAFKNELAGRQWLTEDGRGMYEWNDDRYVQEFGHAWDALKAALKPLEAVAANFASSPKTSAEVAAARVDLKATVERQAKRIEELGLALETRELARNFRDLHVENKRLREALEGMRLPCAQLGDFMYEPVRFCSQQLLEFIDTALAGSPTDGPQTLRCHGTREVLMANGHPDKYAKCLGCPDCAAPQSGEPPKQ